MPSTGLVWLAFVTGICPSYDNYVMRWKRLFITRLFVGQSNDHWWSFHGETVINLNKLLNNHNRVDNDWRCPDVQCTGYNGRFSICIDSLILGIQQDVTHDVDSAGYVSPEGWMMWCVGPLKIGLCLAHIFAIIQTTRRLVRLACRVTGNKLHIVNRTLIAWFMGPT